MEFRLELIKEIWSLLESDINKRNNIFKTQKIQNKLGLIGKVSTGLTMSTGAGGIITASTIALWPATIALDSIVVVCGITLLISTKLFDCIGNKINTYKNINLLAINKLEWINKIFAEDEHIDKTSLTLYHLIMKSFIY